MIRKSLAVALVLLLGYHFILPRLPRNYYWIPSQQRANYVRAQQFVHDAPADARVVVGSSMANELSQDVLGPHYVKLTFPAGGSFTGLDIISRTGKRPPMVLIESNTILRPTDAGICEDSTSPWRRKLRETSPVFKEEGRPSNYEVGFFNSWVQRVCSLGARIMNGGKKPAPVAEAPVSASVLADVMKVNHETLDKHPAKETLAAAVQRMGEQVDALEKAGSRCVFYEMPIDASLRDLAEPVAVREAMRARFPADRYHWLTFDGSHVYQTSDGIHLVKGDAEMVTRSIAEQVDALK